MNKEELKIAGRQVGRNRVNAWAARAMADDEVLKCWKDLGDVPVTNDGKLERGFKTPWKGVSWRKGTDLMDVWRWFDEHHSKGVHWLLYGDAEAHGVEVGQELKKLLSDSFGREFSTSFLLKAFDKVVRGYAVDIGLLTDWYVNSVSKSDEPVWTEKHLEELLDDFYLIPKDISGRCVNNKKKEK